MNNQEKLEIIFKSYRKDLAKQWIIGYNSSIIAKTMAAYFNKKSFKIISKIFFGVVY